ncbi:MAG: ImmA/IrrE family metallo-endopeptidase [Patescibacteria group bacterium]
MKADFSKAESEATDILKNFGVDSPPIPLLDIVSSYGLVISYADFSAIPRGNEIAGFIDLKQNKIVVNEDDAPNRQRFTIAHELGHFIMHQNFIKNNKKYTVLLRRPLKNHNYSSEEQEANCFAASLLVPKDILRNYSELPNGISASLFAVSEDVIKYRKK